MPHTEGDAYGILEARLSARGIDLKKVKDRLKAQEIETPSWGYADSGTRFGVFPQPGAAVTIYEKLADAAQVHKQTGIAPSVATHVLWDLVDDDPAEVKAYAESLGLRIGSINPNVFQDQAYKLGSITNHDPAVRQKAVDHMLECVELGRALDSNVLSLWFADGTNYPGQADFRKRKRWAQECLATVYAAMPADMVMLIEYKFFEPGFYHTDFGDWGMSYVFCSHLGEGAAGRAKVLVDMGHHPQGTNIEHIVAFLIDEGMLGGFHFNDRKYADDDLMTASANPYQLFLVMNEIVSAEGGRAPHSPIAFMVDQSHNIEAKIEAMIRTIVRIQRAYAQALIVDRKTLAQAQEAGDVLAAEGALQEAFNTDVEPLLRAVRQEMGVPEDPVGAYRSSGYAERIAQERGIRAGAGGLGQ